MDNSDPILPRLSAYTDEAAGLGQLLGWGEMAQLGPETGLSNRLGRVLVTHARDRFRDPLQQALSGLARFDPAGQAADSPLTATLFADWHRAGREMELVIHDARRTITGDLDGMPLGQAAFEVLHGPLRLTPAAARTPHWFHCRERCVP